MKPKSTVTNFNLTLILILLNLFGLVVKIFSLSVEQADECNFWDQTCREFNLSQSKENSCQDTHLYYYGIFKMTWDDGRNYCNNIFRGYQSADLLYFDEKNQSNIIRYLENFHYTSETNGDELVLLTSALCCPAFSNTNEKTISCRWLFNSSIIDYYQIAAEIEETKGTINSEELQFHCHYLTIKLNKKDKTFGFYQFQQVASNQRYSIVCTYQKPDFCLNWQTTSPILYTTSVTNKSQPTPTSPFPYNVTTWKPGKIYCLAVENKFGIDYWPSVEANRTSRAKCPDGFEGEAKWKCDMNGKFSSDGPQINCTRIWIQDKIKEIKKINETKELVLQSKEISKKIEKEPPKFFNEIVKIVYVGKVIEEQSRVLAKKSTDEQVINITQSTIDSFSTVISSDQAWELAKKQDKIEISNKILDYVQYSGVTMGCSKARSKHPQKKSVIIEKNIYVNSFVMDEIDEIYFHHKDQDFLLTDKIQDDNENGNFSDLADWCQFRIGVGAIFSKLSSYMFDSDAYQNLHINSEIVAFSYNNRTNQTFRLPGSTEARMSLSHHSSLEFGATIKCVFWDVNSSRWSEEGCYLDQSNSTRFRSVCACNHLTNFAVLMDVSGRERPSSVKSVLSILGCSASIVCLVLTIFFYLWCPELKTRRSTIIINISSVLIIIDLMVLFGLDMIKHSFLCKSVSVLLLYFMLSLFSWMLMEGYNLYQMLILIFSNKGHLKLMYLYAIGYGAPLLITIPSVVYFGIKTELTNEYFCWITSTKYPNQIWVLAAPATLIILINIVIMTRVMKIVLSKKMKRNSAMVPTTIPLKTANTKNGLSKRNLFSNDNNLKNQSSNDSSSKNQQATMQQQITEWFGYLKSFFGLMVLMGITWLSYVLYIHEFGHFFSYFFIVFNSFLGVFIFVTQFLLNQKALNTVRKQINRTFNQKIPSFFSSSSSSGKNTSSTYDNNLSTSRPSVSSTNGQTIRQKTENTTTKTIEQKLQTSITYGNDDQLLIARSASLEF